MTKQPENNYDGNSIELLKFPDCVRSRCGMYIGGSNVDGMHHLLWEIVDNAVDEAVNGFCTRIVITNEGDNTVSVQDNGRGIPFDVNKNTGRSALELVFCELHAGGKFHNEKNTSSYSSSGGLHGVGASVSNACSKKLDVFVKRGERYAYQGYEHGLKTCEVQVSNGSKVDWNGFKNGTLVRFTPDEQVFKHIKIEWDYERVVRRIREVAFLVPGLEIIVRGWKGEGQNDITFKFDNGLQDFVSYSMQNKQRVIDDFVVQANLKDLGCSVNAAFTYETEYDEHFVTFANNICTHEGGVHREAFLSSLQNVIVEVGQHEGLLKGFEGKINKSDVTEGLHAVISVRVTSPEFEGQTKTKLGNPELRVPIEQVITEELSAQFKKRKEDFIKIAEKIIEAVKARDAARKAKDLTRKKSGLEGFSVQGKLAPCESRNPEECELWLVEGDSAGGSAKRGRNRRFQAILPFRGKVINAEKHLINRTMENREIQSLITALNVTPSRGGNVTDADELRYHKIIICADGDSDGAHICCLLLTFFYKFMRTLIENGHVYIAEPPLFRIRQGSKTRYLKNEEEYENYQKTHDMSHVDVSRFKGLGEMNPEQLAETVLNPETRRVLKITLEDAAQAAKTVEALMGSDIDGRKRFLFSELALSDMAL